jgi:hypothetical protein
VVEDAVNKDLLFAGTEFGLFVTIDGGTHWARVSGAPTVAFRDLEAQRREGDLVCGTFGRGIFVLDDYAPLRHLTPETRSKEGVLLPVRRTWAVAELPFARASGEFAAPNPPAGALITFHLREKPAGDAKVVVRVADATGKVVREFPVPAAPGLHRVNWDLRPAGRAGPPGGRRGSGGGAPPLPPGKYTATLEKLTGGEPVTLGKPQTFEVVSPDRPGGKAEP